jgi:hypothetical protein
MIGNKSLTITRAYKTIYSGKGGNNKTTVIVSPPSHGCYLQFQIGAGHTGSVKTYGTVAGSSTTETITTFDTDGIGYSEKLWTAITRFDITVMSGITDISSVTDILIYPANKSGDIITLTTTSTFNIICDHYSVNINQFRGIYPEVSGERFKAFKQIEYDGRFTLLVEDKTTIGDKEYTIFNIDNPETDFYVAFAGASR